MSTNTPIRICEAKNADGLRCTNEALVDNVFCSLHAPRKLQPPTVYDWAKTEYLRSLEARVQNFKDPKGFNLREEIGILRVILERLLANIDDDITLILKSSEVQAIILTIEKLLRTTYDMERQTGELLSRDEVRALASNLLNILVDVLDRLASAERSRFKQIQENLKLLENPDRSNFQEILLSLFALTQTPPDLAKALEEIADKYAETLSVSGKNR